MADQLFLGIECGGTRTVALLTDANSQLIQRSEFGTANLRLLTDAQLLKHFRALGRSFPHPTALGIGMAGMRTKTDRHRILKVAAKVWPRVPCVATDDLETALAAGTQINERSSGPMPILDLPPSALPRVLVLSGTGSCSYGKDPQGQTAKVGGWGHILGDGGSGYDVGLTALKAVITHFDRSGDWPELGKRLLRALQLNEPNQLIAWAQAATKTELAALAVEVFAAWEKRDPIAGKVLEQAANSLCAAAIACARQLARPGSKVQFILGGSNLLKQQRFAKLVAQQLQKTWRNAIVTLLARESAWGAVELAKQHATWDELHETRSSKTKSATQATRSSELSATERRNPRSMNLDKLPPARAIALMLSEDAKIPGALLAERKRIERAVNLIVRTFRSGGRLYYVGAGTSGRLGILDASECPPTFRTPPELVQGIIAGGQPAIWQAVEGAEDDKAAGAQAIQFRGVNKYDVVVGIAASGQTPFVWGALDEAQRRGAKTILVCFNPQLKVPRAARPWLIIAPDIGPEVLTGSTRLKAGTATKLLLNIFTTLAMVRLGKVVGNLMVDLNPSNVKLRDRAVRIVQELTGADEQRAQAALEKTGWVVKAALRKF